MRINRLFHKDVDQAYSKYLLRLAKTEYLPVLWDLKMIYNDDHNILRPSDILPNFSVTTSAMKHDC